MIDYAPTLREALRAVGDRARQRRLARKLRQTELAARAGVGVATVHRFETTGTASLETVLRIATALHMEAGVAALFEAPAYTTLDEALARPAAGARRRAPRRT